MYETEDKEWPEPEKEDRFDWSLSFREMERVYNSGPIKTKKIKIGRYTENLSYTRNIDPRLLEIADNARKDSGPSFHKLDAKFKKRFEYVHTLLNAANPDLLRWIYDNILTKSEWQI